MKTPSWPRKFFAFANTAAAMATADSTAKRPLLEIVFLNCHLEGAILVPEMRKPFDVLVKGLLVPSSRGDCPSFEHLIAAVVDAALSPDTEAIVAKRVVSISA
jgi:hypothetical protein